MKKLIALTGAGVGAAVGTVCAVEPVAVARFLDQTMKAVARAADGIEANPVPVSVALGTFLLTVVYHKARGKSFRESVEVAATRVQVVAVPAPVGEPENQVVKRAQARATRTQLIADQIALENQIRKLPADVKQAEKDVCYTEQAVIETEKSLTARRQAHTEAVEKLDVLRKELTVGRSELSAIAVELKKLAEVV
ncbi:unnamed protein product [Gemmata massiliana]|uniref:Uncharacterized protein n=1 Tax=Gemmata massiliana TaxID=1210884 RepID=A0A6P2CZ11_9BACT|nr:hypothetical protein [Gemmata massiliana]VTR93034.1 unnamed protein product [Gemmata massiliana]